MLYDIYKKHEIHICIAYVICMYFDKFIDLFQEKARVNGKLESYQMQQLVIFLIVFVMGLHEQLTSCFLLISIYSIFLYFILIWLYVSL